MLIQRFATLAGISGVVVSICAAGAFTGACAAQGGGTDDGGGGSGSSNSGSSNSGSSNSGSSNSGSTSGSFGGSSGTSTGTSGTATGSTSGSFAGSSGTATGSTSGSFAGSSGTATGSSGTVTGTTGTAGTVTGTSGTATGTTGTTGTATGASGTVAGTCTVVSTGGLPLLSNYLASGAGGNPGMGGYAFAYDDMLGSLTCIEGTAFCGSGTIAAQNATFTIFGGGLGVNINQAMATSTASPPIGTTAATGSGVKYTVTSLPTLGLRIAIDNGGVDYCAKATAATGTIPWAMFNTKCYDPTPDGLALTGPPATATHIEFQVPPGMAAGTFDFCVTALSFAP